MADDESASVSLAATLINYLNDFLTIISISSTLSLQIVSKVVYLFYFYLLVGSNFTVKGNIQDVTKVTGTITKQKHNNKQSQSSLIFVKIKFLVNFQSKSSSIFVLHVQNSFQSYISL